MLFQAVLGDPILEAMERDYRNLAHLTEMDDSISNRAFQFIQLIIHGDPERLECQRSRMQMFFASRDRFNGRDELQRCSDRTFLALGHNRSRNGSRPRLFAILSQDSNEILFFPSVHNLLGRQIGFLIHPHIERTFSPKRKSPMRLVYLWRADPQIQQNAID